MGRLGIACEEGSLGGSWGATSSASTEHPLVGVTGLGGPKEQGLSSDGTLGGTVKMVGPGQRF